MTRTLVLAAACVAALSAAASADAGCAYPGKAAAGSAHILPASVAAQLAASTSQSAAEGNKGAASRIVGSWLATYTVEGAPFAQALIQWHDDYTEWENINLPIEGGNVCVGSWKVVDTAHVARTHIGWLYSAGTLTGYFVETETDKVRTRNTYSGVNEQKIYDLSGNLLADVTGTASAVRINP